ALAARIGADPSPPTVVRARYLASTLRAAPANPPGTFSYSNTGYVVAATMLERVTGVSYESLMRRHVFDPLGMKSAGFGPPGRGRRGADQPRGHDEGGRPVGVGPEADAPAVLNPAGLIHLNLSDWSRFLSAHLGQRVNGVALLTAASLKKLHTPDPRPVDGSGSGYGFGWVTIDTPLGKGLWHNGTNGFWHSEAVIVPSKNLAAFAVANQGGARGEAASGAALVGLLEKLRRWQNGR
ncbi:MAG: serine hydrolase domain-containing protein, partial [Gemmataceae bacterium]